MVNFRTHVTTVFWLMKFFPLAFLVAFGEGENPAFYERQFDCVNNLSPDAAVLVKLSLRPIPHPMWPESPDADCAILYGDDDAVTIKPRTRILSS